MLKGELKLDEPLSAVKVAYWGEAPVAYEVAKQREEEAYARGRAEAEEFAQLQIVETRNEFLQIQESLFQQLENQFEELVGAVNRRLPPLVLTIVRRLWGNLELDPESVKNILDELLTEISPEGEEMEVNLHPEDFALLSKLETGVETHYPHIKFVEDASLKPGDCVVRSRFGLVDGRVETKLKKLEEDLNNS